jgi:hypothetical protein
MKSQGAFRAGLPEIAMPFSFRMPSGPQCCRVVPPESPGSGRVHGINQFPVSRLTIMRKLAIASLLVAGVALSGSVLAQAAPQADAAGKSTTEQAAPKKAAKHHKAHKAAAKAAPAATSSK